MAAPIVKADIPAQQASENTPFEDLDLTAYFQSDEALSFQASLDNGEPLPLGMTCSMEGSISGFPGDATQGQYNIIVTAENASGSVQANFQLVIAAPVAAEKEEVKAEKIDEPIIIAPSLLKEIPAQVINEKAAYGPFTLKDFFSGENLHFHAELSSGQALPQGLICTADGILTGIPAKGTQGNHEVKITAENSAGKIEATFIFVIKPIPVSDHDADYIAKLKAQVWEALEQRLPIPDIASLYEQSITQQDIAYLLDRWGFLAIWDAFNLEPLSEKRPLVLEGASPHYDIYDRGCAIVACPKDLFSHERTIEDSLQTARAVAREVYKRNWAVEITGVAKMTRAAWVEVQHLGDQYGKPLEVINFTPRPDDVKIYVSQSMSRKSGG